MDVVAYLSRIGVDFVPEPTAENLKFLQKQHLYTVPYENTDILKGIPIVPEKEALYRKIVTRHRGGYCFELNELFGHLLRELGYGVTDVFGRFLRGETGIPMRRHHILIVTAKDGTRLLADVGVGSGSPTEAMELYEGSTYKDLDVTYRLRRDNVFSNVLEETHEGGWRPVYCFTEEKQYPIDFVTTSFYCEKAPDSIFNKTYMVSLRTPEGRRTRDGDEFRIFNNGSVTAFTPSPSEADKLMAEWFGLDEN